MARLRSLRRESLKVEARVEVSGKFDLLVLEWEDNSGCTSSLTSINLRLRPGELFSTKTTIHSCITRDRISKEAYKTTQIEPETYSIPQSCMKQVPRDGNIFSVTLSLNNSTCFVPWGPLEKGRNYYVEMESQYSFSWTGPSSSQMIGVYCEGRVLEWTDY